MHIEPLFIASKVFMSERKPSELSTFCIQRLPMLINEFPVLLLNSKQHFFEYNLLVRSYCLDIKFISRGNTLGPSSFYHYILFCLPCLLCNSFSKSFLFNLKHSFFINSVFKVMLFHKIF